MEIGIIGFGRFGRLLTRYLSGACDVLVYSDSADPEVIRSAGGVAGSIETACRREVVIPAVPISAFEEIVIRMTPHLHENLVIDVCSVKEYPVEIMTQHIPEPTQILGTHPMFGPDSASESVRGQKIVLTPVRIEPVLYQSIQRFLRGKGLELIETTPENHDREIARSQVLTHFIGRALAMLGAEDIRINTEGYKRLLKILEVVDNDTVQLFRDLNRFNRFAHEIREHLIESLESIHQDLQ